MREADPLVVPENPEPNVKRIIIRPAPEEDEEFGEPYPPGFVGVVVSNDAYEEEKVLAESDICATASEAARAVVEIIKAGL